MAVKQNLKSASVQDLNPVIHERSRLAIMTYLISVREATFTEVKSELGLTDGNLTLHVKVLEKHGYARVQKALVRRRPRTTYQVTERGVRAFQEYVALLERILEVSRRGHVDRD
jgi:DNA-binding MarR family transcriptional regulator